MNAAADALCRRARAAELRLTDEVLPDLQRAQSQTSHCLGERDTLQRQLSLVESVKPPWRPPLLLRLSLDVGIGALAGATGAVAGVGGPPELIVGLAVGSVAVLVGRVVLEVLR